MHNADGVLGSCVAALHRIADRLIDRAQKGSVKRRGDIRRSGRMRYDGFTPQ
jgi:hypothetical protein